ncbi:MAG TPA: DUF58 domain-containing protein [Gaiellaceae bacterium]|jgi:uncharacterized protein (DUF58 family)|nr:DUF58 domain-containing protein [Gaiellaceae bacterium]
MRRVAGPRLEGYATVVATGLVAALALRRPELAALAAPFALLLAAGLRPAAAPRLEVSLTLAGERVVEGDALAATLSVRSERALDRLELALALPAGIEVVDGAAALALRLRAGEERRLPITLTCRRWGVYDLGRVEVRVRDPFRLLAWQGSVGRRQRLRAYPRSETLRRLLPPRETQAFAGSEVARAKADGIEFADLRAYVPGDRVRSIHWRASARRGALVVGERHPERNTDVVLFVDSFADVRRGERSTLDDAVRATAALAASYLQRRDRVGLVTFGGVLRWLQPGLGLAQRYRLVETVLETGVEPTYTWRDVSVLPARILPPKALVLAITPLVDERFVAALADLRARRFDVAVLEVDPEPLVEPGPGELDRLAYRLWLLEREVLRFRLARLGIACARFGEGSPLAAALEGVRTYRRHARLVRA